LSKTTKELRSYQGSQPALEYRAVGDKRTVSGTAIVYGSLSQDLGGWFEKIQAGAFTQSLRSADLLLLNNHNTSQVLGRQSAGTLSVNDTSSGLQFSASLGTASFAQDVASMLARREIQGCSFGFIVDPGGDDWSNENGQIVRTVKSASLFEITLTSGPAYLQTSAQVRSAALANCPVELRSMIDSDDDQDCDEEDKDEDGNCPDEEDRDDPCTDDSDSEECDEVRKDQLRVKQLFNHRMKD